MKLRVNGVDREFPHGATLAAVLAEVGVPASGVAVALDGAVVPRAGWPDAIPAEGATVEILTAVQGG